MLALIGIGAFLALVVMSIIIGGFFVWLGAKMASIEGATFGKAILASIAASVASALVSWLFSFIGSDAFWSLIGGIIGLIIVLWVFKSIFDTTWGKAFLAWLFQVIAIAIVVVIAGLTFATALFL